MINRTYNIETPEKMFKIYDRRSMPFVLERQKHTKILSKRIEHIIVNKITSECINGQHYKCNRITCGCSHHIRPQTIGDLIQAQFNINKLKLINKGVK